MKLKKFWFAIAAENSPQKSAPAVAVNYLSLR